MYRANCGTKNEDGAKFCRQCGSPMIRRRTQPEAARDADGTAGAGGSANRESTAGAGSTNTDSVMNYSRRAENGAGAPGRGAASKKKSSVTIVAVVAIAAAACVVIALLVSGVLFPKTAQSGDAQSGESQSVDVAAGWSSEDELIADLYDVLNGDMEFEEFLKKTDLRLVYAPYIATEFATESLLSAERVYDLFDDPEKAASYINENCPELLSWRLYDKLVSDAGFQDFLVFCSENGVDSVQELVESKIIYTELREKYLYIYDLQEPLPEYDVSEEDIVKLLSGEEQLTENFFSQNLTEYVNEYGPFDRYTLEKSGDDDGIYSHPDIFPDGGAASISERINESVYGSYWEYSIDNKDTSNYTDSLEIEYILKDGKYYWFDLRRVIV